ncbi:MAG TPA: DUF1329 domain-containing protein [Casimicrobiaceae bacterium]|nr:DUF1329 domain-containing protein [Myxococcota bacterium]HTS23020.1 DUF1329 domain-containing protein [Casimicrobiaceae bacterium]
MKRTSISAAALAALLAFPYAPARADVSPGDVITAANKEKVRGLVPDEFYTYAIENFPDLEMKIVASADYPVHPKYVEATQQFACQASIDASGRLVNYTAGQPFPFSEWAKTATGHKCDLTPDDPQFALKLAWDVNYRWQGGSGFNLPHWGFANMRNMGHEEWRLSQGEYRRTYFSARADLLPDTTELEKGTNVEWAEYFDVKSPFDLRGTMFLLYRYRDNKEDDTWAYIPALRRVRRIAATQKSDSLLGTEFTLEDFYLFSGYVWNHSWEFKGEKTFLSVPDSGRTCFPKASGATNARSMVRLGTDEEWRACRFDPYGALPMVGESWQKRTSFELDDIPKQEGHPYSRKKIWYDKETMSPGLAVAYDRGGKPFKLIGGVGRWSETSGITENKGHFVLLGSSVMIVNLQSGNSNLGQFDGMNAMEFSIAESRKYYDTTKLKTEGH